jgi:hypothetical protein
MPTGCPIESVIIFHSSGCCSLKSSLSHTKWQAVLCLMTHFRILSTYAIRPLVSSLFAAVRARSAATPAMSELRQFADKRCIGLMSMTICSVMSSMSGGRVGQVCSGQFFTCHALATFGKYACAHLPIVKECVVQKVRYGATEPH